MTRALAGGERFNLIFGSGAGGLCWACSMDRGSALAHLVEYLWRVHVSFEKPFLQEDVADWRSRGAMRVMGAHHKPLWRICRCDEDACLDI